MGTETIFQTVGGFVFACLFVKLNNPQMGTETVPPHNSNRRQTQFC